MMNEKLITDLVKLYKFDNSVLDTYFIELLKCIATNHNETTQQEPVWFVIQNNVLIMNYEDSWTTSEIIVKNIHFVFNLQHNQIELWLDTKINGDLTKYLANTIKVQNISALWEIIKNIFA